MENKNKRDVKRAALVRYTSELCGVSPNQVQKVLRTERDNELVVSVFMELTERMPVLLDEVKKLIPFNNNI